MQNKINYKEGLFLPGEDKAVLLIHGITGTPSEMHYLAKAINKAGYTVFCNRLPRHCQTLAELKKVTWQEIVLACQNDLFRLKKDYNLVFVGGLSMGALVAVHLAYLFPEKVTGIIALAPTFSYDGWAVHKGRLFLQLIWEIPWVRKFIDIRESWPYGLKDENLRLVIERFYKNAKGKGFKDQVILFGSPFFPLACLYQHQIFNKVVKKELPFVKKPILILHARCDDMTSLKNAQYLFNHIGSSDKSLVILEDSYHMITIDKEKDKVVDAVINFLQKF